MLRFVIRPSEKRKFILFEYGLLNFYGDRGPAFVHLSSIASQVSKVPELSEWRLYLVDWGYNTEIERHRAQQTGRIEVISVEDFQRLAGLVHS